MKKLLSSDKIYISKSKIKNAGNGVFAKRNIKKGEVVETAPFIVISGDIDNNTLFNYVFHFGKKKETKVLALGFGSIYNHSVSPNVKFTLKPKEMTIEYIALTNIAKDEEITFNYYGEEKVNDKSKLWFEI